MASPQSTEQSSLQPPAEQAQVQAQEETGEQSGEQQAGVNEVEQGLQGLSVSGGEEFALHRACAEGRLDGVREVLTGSLDTLETLDETTGCTPIVLAIRNGHYEIVRELLTAGAIVPPSGITNDQQMLSLLYPQHLYGMPQYMHSQQHQHQPDFYGHAQAPFYASNGSGTAGYPYSQRGEQSNANAGGSAQSQSNLPPVEVAKTIPCRNFPNCKYGNNCAFFHPRPNQFYGQGQPGYGFDAGFQGYQQVGVAGQQHGMGYPQNGFGQLPHHLQQQQQQFSSHFQDNQHPYQQQQQYQQYQHAQQQQQQQQHLPQQQTQSAIPEHDSNAPEIPGSEDQPIENTDNTAITESTEQPLGSTVTSGSNGLNTVSAPFIPSFQSSQLAQESLSPVQPSQFGASPISPSLLGASLPSIPPAEQFFAAASPPNAYMPMPTQGFAPVAHMPMMPIGHSRRLSFNQFGIPPNGVPIPGANGSGAAKPFGGHGKKLSFSGGARPFAPGAGAGIAGIGGGKLGGMDFGKWKDGMPPPCAFFIQGKCRNGEMCKFPHVDAEGNDCRHPDVVRGLIAPLPSLGRPPRPPRQFGSFDPAFRQQQLVFLQQQRAAVQQAQNMPATASASTTAASLNSGASAANQQAQQPTTEDISASQVLVNNPESTSTTETTNEVEKTPAAAPATATATGVSSLPPKPVTATNTPSLAPVPVLVRSASQPGVQRVHVNGFSSRSQSPAPSNVSFHGNGHPRRNNSRPPFAPMMNGHANGHAHVNGNGHGVPNGHAGVNGHGPRGPSAGGKAPAGPAASGAGAGNRRNQRVPGADEFPALGGLGVESKQTSPVARGRTAAEVLSAPAPEKPVVKVTRDHSVDSKESDDQSITMDSDNDSDGVIISTKPSAPASKAPSSVNGDNISPVKRPSVSFARIAGAVNGGNTGPAETAPIAVKA